MYFFCTRKQHLVHQLFASVVALQGAENFKASAPESSAGRAQQGRRIPRVLILLPAGGGNSGEERRKVEMVVVVGKVRVCQ